MLRQDELEALARTAVDCGYRLHRDVGPGLLESVYEVLLAEYLRDCGLMVARQVRVPITYKERVLDEAFRADIVVEGKLLIELKSAERISLVHPKQVLTYLRLMNLPLGLLMSFGQGTFNDGLKRVANGYYGQMQ